jgi:hypothetical protein
MVTSGNSQRKRRDADSSLGQPGKGTSAAGQPPDDDASAPVRVGSVPSAARSAQRCGAPSSALVWAARRASARVPKASTVALSSGAAAKRDAAAAVWPRSVCLGDTNNRRCKHAGANELYAGRGVTE